MKKILLLTSSLFFVLLVFGQKLPFQGKLIESGTPVNGTRSIEVGLPGLSWSETHVGVQITDGLYFIVLGNITPLPANLFTDIDERQLTISVDGTALSPVILYKPLADMLDSLYLKGPGNGLLRAGFGTGSSLNENRPSLTMRGNMEGDRLSLNVTGNNDSTFEAGNIRLNSSGGYVTSIGSGSIFLSGSPGQASLFASNELWLLNEGTFNLQLFNQNWSNKGHAGTILLRGPNSINFEIGNKHWENPDIPWMNMQGTTNASLVQLSGEKYQDAGVDKEMGQIKILSSDGSFMQYEYGGVRSSTGPFNMWSGARVNGTLELNGDFTGSGTQSYTSDQRLKKDIQPLGKNILGKIESIEGVSYFWRKNEFPKKNFSDDKQIGLIAQQLEAQFPALVKTNDDGFKSVNYNGFTAVLLEAVKEMNAKVETLESENRTLQVELSTLAIQSAELTELKNQVEFLTKLVQDKITSDSEKTAEKK